MDEDWVDDGITLWGDCGEFALRPGWWQAMLGLARQHGWSPAGTQPPPDYSGWEGDPTAWDGRYWPGEGQQVTGADARNLGAALARAWADIPDHPGRPDFSYWSGWRPGAIRREWPDVPALELLSGPESKEVLGWFLQHCDGGDDGCCRGFDICDFDYMTLHYD
jgi:hypothetical protein